MLHVVEYRWVPAGGVLSTTGHVTTLVYICSLDTFGCIQICCDKNILHKQKTTDNLRIILSPIMYTPGSNLLPCSQQTLWYLQHASDQLYVVNDNSSDLSMITVALHHPTEGSFTQSTLTHHSYMAYATTII
jgi:hypothetical protein